MAKITIQKDGGTAIELNEEDLGFLLNLLAQTAGTIAIEPARRLYDMAKRILNPSEDNDEKTDSDTSDSGD